MMQEKPWVLRETLASTRVGKPVYFHMMTGIGPKGTADLAEAARFASAEEAKQSPAYFHSLSFYEPEQIR